MPKSGLVRTVDIDERDRLAYQFKVAPEQVERDYLVSYLLAFLSERFGDRIQFIGGTALARALLPKGGRLAWSLTTPPVWINPTERGWAPMPVHQAYGLPELPMLPVIRLEENIAEKVARLNRVTTARDMYDLAWIANHRHDLPDLDTDLIR